MGGAPLSGPALIGHQVQVCRTRGRMTRRDLSEATGIPYSTLGKFETGISEPKASQLVCIAKALGVEVSELVEGVYMNH